MGVCRAFWRRDAREQPSPKNKKRKSINLDQITSPLVKLVVLCLPDQRPRVCHPGIDESKEARVLRLRVALAEGDLSHKGVVKCGRSAQFLLAVVALYLMKALVFLLEGKKRGGTREEKKGEFFLFF